MKGPKNETGGWGGIRTLETLARLPVFKTGAFNHSATHPYKELNWLVAPTQATKQELPPDCHRRGNITVPAAFLDVPRRRAEADALRPPKGSFCLLWS